MSAPLTFGSKDLRPQPSVQLPQLKATNDWRRIRKQCMPLFDLAEGKSAEAQLAIHTTMIHQIAAVLDIEPTAHDLDPHPYFRQRIIINSNPRELLNDWLRFSYLSALKPPAGGLTIHGSVV